VRDLVPTGPVRRRWGRAVETSVVLRALAIVLVVGTHAKLFDLTGSAHVLLAVAGYNFARFQLTADPRAERLRHQARSIARVALPSMAWIGAAFLLTDSYRLHNVLLLNAVVGSPRWSPQWNFWFVEVLVLSLVAMTALLAVPWADQLERRFPFAFPCALVAVALLWRFHPETLDLLHTKPTLWLFALGWATARASTTGARLLVSATAALTVPGFFDDPSRDGVILAGVLILLWVPAVRLPTLLSRGAGVLASASLYIYLTHWQVYPELQPLSPALAVAASVVVGIAYWQLVTRLSRWGSTLRGASGGRRKPQPGAAPAPSARRRR